MKSDIVKTWKHGDRVKIAKMAGKSKQHLCDVLKRRIRCTSDTATLFEIACTFYGYQVTRKDFLYNFETENPLFG